MCLILIAARLDLVDFKFMMARIIYRDFNCLMARKWAKCSILTMARKRCLGLISLMTHIFVLVFKLFSARIHVSDFKYFLACSSTRKLVMC